MSSSYEKVKGSKLTFKGDLGLERKITKKTKKKKKPQQQQHDDQGVDEGEDAGNLESTVGGAVDNSTEPTFEVDTGTGHAPDGKKSKKYEELFPVETRRHGYVVPVVDSRQAALEERIMKKADRYCK